MQEKQKKTVYIVLAAVLVFGAAISVAAMSYRVSCSASNLIFTEISIDKEKPSITIKGSSLSSGLSYRSFSYKLVDDTLILEIYYGLVFSNYRDGSFDIVINDQEVSRVTTILVHANGIYTQVFPNM